MGAPLSLVARIRVLGCGDVFPLVDTTGGLSFPTLFTRGQKTHKVLGLQSLVFPSPCLA